MNDLIVLTGASCVHGTMELYLRQLADAKIDVHVEDLSKTDLGIGAHMDYKIRYIRDLVGRFQHYERIVMTDAFDVTFYGSREDVIRKIPTDHILWGAEKNCYPDPSIAVRIPDRGPWRFTNGGLVCGTPENFVKWCDAVESHPTLLSGYLDQQFMNILLSEESDLCHIDHRTELFFCLYCGYPELDFEKGLPVNTLYGTHPNWIHANGGSGTDGMWAAYNRSLA